MMKWVRRRVGACIAFIAVVAGAGVGPTLAAGNPNPVASVESSPSAASAGQGAQRANRLRAVDKADVDAWLDGLVPYALKSGDMAGAVVVVVDGDRVVTARGFGYADIAKRKPVDPERTLFRPGSIAKLFTWTAVMQQVERGKIDLDADINRYLDFKIPDRADGPITMRHLMTHRAGFEETVRGLITEPGDKRLSLGDDLKRWIPSRIYKAGTTPAYSNYGTGLAGYIVERVSGVPFEDYVQKNIFARLGMTNSTFVQPLPKSLSSFMSAGYESAALDPKPFEIVVNAPAGALSSTGTDMARFMIAHLNGGGPLLSPETAHLMQTSFTPEKGGAMNRMALGFYEQTLNGAHAIAHGGDTQWFHSNLVLWPGQRLGLYMSVNSTGQMGAAGKLRDLLLKQFVERYIASPVADSAKVDPKVAAREAAAVQGQYWFTRRSASSFLSVSGLLGQLAVTALPDGRLSTPSMHVPGATDYWDPIGAGEWRRSDGAETLSVRRENGQVIGIALGTYAPIVMFDRVPAAANASVTLPLLGASLLVALLFVVGGILGRFFRYRYSVQPALLGQEQRARRALLIVAGGSLAAFAGWAAMFTLASGGISMLNGALDPLLRASQIASLVFLPALPLFAGWNLWQAFRSRHWYRFGGGVLILLAALVLLWVAGTFNLLSLQLDY